MTEKTRTKDTYELDDNEKQSIINDSVSDMSDKLSGYQMNTKMQQAWISKIVPPESDEDIQIHQKSDQIAIEFLLPSDDVFWETFEFPDMRWPEDNEFRKFMENIGYHNPSDIPNMIGEPVDVNYDESIDKWVTDVEPEPKTTEKLKKKVSTVDTKRTIKMVFSYTIIGLAVLSCLFLLALFRHLAIIPVIAMGFILYVFYQMNQDFLK